jgi:hypothetical protein
MAIIDRNAILPYSGKLVRVCWRCVAGSFYDLATLRLCVKNSGCNPS